MTSDIGKTNKQHNDDSTGSETQEKKAPAVISANENIIERQVVFSSSDESTDSSSEEEDYDDHYDDDEGEPEAKKARMGSVSSELGEEGGDEECKDIRKSLEQRTEVELPDYKKDVDPDKYLQQLMEAMFGFRLNVKPALQLFGYFPEVTEEQIAAYDMKVVAAARESKVEVLRELHANGQTMECCNRFGESLLHMACRRGFHSIVAFLLEEVDVRVRIRDDWGRTPLHDVCWNPNTQLELAAKLLARDPTLLLISDKRGHTPFQYARPQDWPTWRKFLFDQRQTLTGLVKEETQEIFG